MRAMVFHGPGDLRREDLPVPAPEHGELVMRIDAALTCGTDLKVFKRGYHAKMLTPPAVFGHELAGIVAHEMAAGFQPTSGPATSVNSGGVDMGPTLSDGADGGRNRRTPATVLRRGPGFDRIRCEPTADADVSR